MNNVVGMTSRLPGIDDHFARIRFLKRLKTIDRFQEIFLQGTADQVREKRDELEAGKSLLDNPQVIALCEALIKTYTARLYTIPHERHLQGEFRKGTFD